MEIVEKAPAKLNLSLDALFKHCDGKPEWKMVMTAIDLVDYVYIKRNTSFEEIKIYTNKSFLPRDKKNLAYQAAKMLKKKFKLKGGISITIKKNIPVCAGMGGGSADAAAVLRGINKLWKLNLSIKELEKLGISIDSDVPFCVYSCPALVEGKGEKITPLNNINDIQFIIVKPNTNISTPKILKQIKFNKIKHPNVNKVVSAIQNSNWNKLANNMGNCLEPITTVICPQIKQIEKKMIKFGAENAQMSGTGPTVFGIFKSNYNIQRIYNSLKGFCKEVYLAKPLNLNFKN